MRQLFFIPSCGPELLRTQVPGATFHIWTDDDGQSVGVVNMDGSCDSDLVVNALQNTCSCLPNHFGSDPLGPDCVQKLAKYGVLVGDTTAQAMTKVHAIAGFPHLKPRQF